MRIAYWTTAPLEHEFEAVSQEVFALAQRFAAGRMVAISPHLSLVVRQNGKVLGFNPRLDPLLRLLVPILESRGDINHVYGDVLPWTLFKALRRKPIVLTLCAEHGIPAPEFLERCKMVVVQTPRMVQALETRGVASSKLRLIFPGVDLRKFKTSNRSRASSTLRILFATFPRSAEEMRERGVDFLMDVAAKLEDVQFTFVSRPWRSKNSALDTVTRAIAERALRNVTVLHGLQTDMEALYRDHDFTVIPYTSADGGKEVPRSLVESLACGKPVLMSAAAPFSAFVAEHACGEVFDLAPESFAGALERARARYDELSVNATRCALAAFDAAETLSAYARVYEDVVRT